jgi:cytoskeletal protein CcmA (bactofilin family)
MELPQLRWSMNISAREVVVLGVVRGDINASERVDLRSEGSLSGDVIRQHITIGDGAFFKGIVDIQKLGQGNDGNGGRPNFERRVARERRS